MKKAFEDRRNKLNKIDNRRKGKEALTRVVPLL
jgi:hypothetical protein